MPVKPRSFNVVRTSEVSKELLDLLETTVLGTPGKLRYKQIDVASTLRSLDNLEFIQIKKGTRVLGTAGFIQRSTVHNQQNLDTLYVRYLSVFNPMKKRLKVKPLASTKRNRRAGLRDQILSIFNKKLEFSFQESKKSGMYYAFVESDNILSRNLCESFGFKASRQISTFLFSRFSPSKSPEVKLLGSDEYQIFRNGVSNFYKHHSLFFEDKFSTKSHVFGYFENGEMVAGLRAFPVRWKLVEVPGFSGFLMQKVLPYLPFFRSIFNPEKLNYLAFDNIWAQPNKEFAISKLMEHSCAHLNINMGMAWLDNSCALTKYFSQKASLGFLHQINGVVTADLMTRAINMSVDQQKEVLDKPIFISAVDMT